MELYCRNAFVPSSLTFSLLGLTSHVMNMDLQPHFQWLYYIPFFQLCPLYLVRPRLIFGHVGCSQSFCLVNNAAVNITGHSSSRTCITRITFRSRVTETEAKSSCSTLIKSLWCQLDFGVSTRARTQASCLIPLSLRSLLYKTEQQICNPYPSF